jgi:ketosteroid isomerase-like protein
MTLLILSLLVTMIGQSKDSNEPARQIRLMLEGQQQDWNRGDIESFMRGYERGDSLIFTSGGKIFRGWDEALRRYKATYRDRDAMGQLEFSELEITFLSDTAAIVLGKWSLQRRSDSPGGVFTLALRKGSDGWKIIHDHTSSYETAKN